MLDRTETPEAEIKDGPSLYDGLSLEVEQILLGYNVLTAKMRDFKGAVDFKQDVTVKLIADDLAKVTSQISIMASHVSSVVARHINRKPRVS